MKALAIADNRISSACERSLLIQGFEVIKLPPSKYLSKPIASHPDMLMTVHKSTVISSCAYCDEAAFVFSDIRELSPKSRIVFTDEESEKKYPRDAIFNVLIMGGVLFCKTDSVSKKVLEYAAQVGLTVKHVNQGYPACTTLALGNSHAITADPGMAKALSESNVEVTLINNGGILLPPYEYGFIGGCAGVFDDTVYFLGNPDMHPDGNKYYQRAIMRDSRHFRYQTSLYRTSGELFLFSTITAKAPITGKKTSPNIPNTE